MELLTRAKALERAGHDVIHMEVGEPDFPTPPAVIDAAQRAIADGFVRYTPSLGIPELREAISHFYQHRYGLNVPASRIVVTAGASGALMLALACLVTPGQRWLVTDPGYPCNRHFIRTFEGQPEGIPVSAASNFQPTAELIDRHWDESTGGALFASPSNPTGTIIAPDQLAAISTEIRRRGGHLIVDEIYHGLTYGFDATSALAIDDDAFIVQSFSKYFQMTGWRLGWLVVPPRFVRDIEKLAQNLFISPSAPAQAGALAVFSPETLTLLEARRKQFRDRRDALLPALESAGFTIPATPDGAFYIYADSTKLATDSFTLAQQLLDNAHVAITPGIDFGANKPERFVRFAYTDSNERLLEAVSRIRRFVG
jgi:aspartate/methionine/tyrosine aminotransferase